MKLNEDKIKREILEFKNFGLEIDFNFDFKKNIDHLLNKNFQFICVNSSLGVTLRHEKGESVTFIGCPECSVNIKHIDKIGNYKLYSLCEKKGMYE